MIEMPEEQLCRLLDEIEEQNKCKKKENRCEKQRKREKYKRGKERRICKRNQNKFKKQRKRRRCKRVHKQKSCRYSLKLDGKRKRRTSDLGTIRFNIRNTSRIPRAGTVSKGLNCSEVKTKREKRGMIAFAGFTICFASVSSLVRFFFKSKLSFFYHFYHFFIGALASPDWGILFRHDSDTLSVAVQCCC